MKLAANHHDPPCHVYDRFHEIAELVRSNGDELRSDDLACDDP
jgi:hypothetical protein